MLRSLSERIAVFLIDNGANADLKKVYSYGIECTLSTLLILALLMAAGFILKKPVEMLLYILAWLPLRMLVGGAHANAHWSCTLVSVALGVVSVLFTGLINALPLYVSIPLTVLSYAVFFLTAPVVHRNHPISLDRWRKTRIIARIYAAVECAVIILLAYLRSPAMAPVFMGFLATAVLAVIGFFSRNTLRYPGNNDRPA